MSEIDPPAPETEYIREVEVQDDPLFGTPRFDPTLNKTLWVIGICLYLFLVSAEFYGWLATRTDSIASMQAEQVLSTERIALTTKSLVKSEKGQKQVKSDVEKQYQEVLTKLDEAKAKDADAAILRAYANLKLGKPISETGLGVLTEKTKKGKAPEPWLADAKKAFTEQPMTEARAKALAAGLSPHGTSGKLAAIAAYQRAGVDQPASKVLKPINGGLLIVSVGGFFALLALGICAWALYFVKAPEWKPEGHPLQDLPKETGGAMMLTMMLLFFGFVVFSTAAGLLGGSSSKSESLVSPFSILGSIAFLLTVFTFLFVVKPGGKSLLSMFFASSKSIGQQILWGIGGYAANVPVLAILLLATTPLTSKLGGSHPASDELTQGVSPAQLGMLLFFGSIAAPIWEEIAFRGFLFGALLRRFAPVGSALLTGLMFAAVHPQGPALWLALGWIGTMAAMLTYQTRSLLPSIVMHFLHNTTLFMVAYLFSQ